MSAKFVAIVPAAGNSTRLSLHPEVKRLGSKLLVSVAGEIVLKKTLSVIFSNSKISKIILPVSASMQEVFSREVLAWGFASKVEVIKGGDTRKLSVFEGLKHLEKSEKEAILNNDLFVLVHDAARCFITERLIEESLKAVQDFLAVTLAIPVIDTIVEVEALNKSQIKQGLDRSKLMAVQTPQTFRYDLLHQAHLLEGVDASDDAGLVRKMYPVKIIEGNSKNIKITLPEDLA